MRTLDLSPDPDLALELATERLGTRVVIRCPPPLERIVTPSLPPQPPWLQKLAMIPQGAWKRMAVYPVLLVFFGNLLLCRGLPMWLNVLAIAVAIPSVVATLALPE